MTAPGRAGLVGRPGPAAIGAFPLALFLWRRSLGVTLLARSGDDVHRTLYGREVTSHLRLASDLWPPLQLWLRALLLRICPHILPVPCPSLLRPDLMAVGSRVGALRAARRLRIPVLLPGGEHTLDGASNPSLLALPPAERRAAPEERGETEHAGRFHIFPLDPTAT